MLFARLAVVLSVCHSNGLDLQRLSGVDPAGQFLMLAASDFSFLKLCLICVSKYRDKNHVRPILAFIIFHHEIPLRIF